MLLRRGARPEVADQQRAVPLHKAAEYRSTEVATLLLENGSVQNDIMFEDINRIATNYKTNI